MQHDRTRGPQEDGVDKERRQKQRYLGKDGADHGSAVSDEALNHARFRALRNALSRFPRKPTQLS
jgi:hypothetical protein